MRAKFVALVISAAVAMGGVVVAAGRSDAATPAGTALSTVPAVTDVQWYPGGYGYGGGGDWRYRHWRHEAWRRHIRHERWREYRAYQAGVNAGRYGY